MLKAFVDDSGSGGESTWYVLAGYVASVEAWDAFEPEWTATLNAERRIENFHAAEAESLKGQFAGFTATQRNLKIDALIGVIQKHARQAICVRLRQRHFDEVIKGNVPPMWNSAYYFLFPSFVQAVIAMERHMGHGEQVSLVFDSSERFEKGSQLQYAQFADLPLFANCVVNISYEDDEKFIPLQAADLLAWQIRRAFSVTTERRRAHFDESRKCAWPCFDYIVTKKDLEDCLELMEEQARRHAAAMGIPLEVLQSWKKA